MSKPTTLTPAQKRRLYSDMTRRRGRFEGERRYVPYFWEQYLEGGADDDDGKVLTFRIIDEDRSLFPELKGRQTVRLCQMDTGFVLEV